MQKITIQPEATNHFQIVFGTMVLDVLATDFLSKYQIDIRHVHSGEAFLNADGSVTLIKIRPSSQEAPK